MIHLNLDFTYMAENLVRIFVPNLKYSINLRCIHLTGNFDITDDFKEWAAKKIQAIPIIEERDHVEMFTSAKKKLKAIAKKSRKLKR